MLHRSVLGRRQHRTLDLDHDSAAVSDIAFDPRLCDRPRRRPRLRLLEVHSASAGPTAVTTSEAPSTAANVTPKRRCPARRESRNVASELDERVDGEEDHRGKCRDSHRSQWNGGTLIPSTNVAIHTSRSRFPGVRCRSASTKPPRAAARPTHDKRARDRMERIEREVAHEAGAPRRVRAPRLPADRVQRFIIGTHLFIAVPKETAGNAPDRGLRWLVLTLPESAPNEDEIEPAGADE